jgi:6-phosphogluconolactonase (cycloisomerase 2 family)
VTVHQSQIISSFISGTAPKGAAAGGIVLHPNQKDLYITNRLTGGKSDTLAHFKIDSGFLTPGKENPTGGILPRMLSISKSGKEIFLGNQNGPAAAVAFGINEDGSIDATPKATLDLSVFGEKGSGPPYIAEI